MSFFYQSKKHLTKLPLHKVASAKACCASIASAYVQSGMIIGLGTGSTTNYFIEYLGLRIAKEGLNIQATTTSLESENLAKQWKIPLIKENSFSKLDLSVDGADEIDPQRNMIKGGGGALFKEKIIAECSDLYIIIVEERKCVSQLGAFKLPVELSPFGYQASLKRVSEIGFTPFLRIDKNNKPFISQQGNYIADLQVKKPWNDPKKDHLLLLQIPGVIETGLFVNTSPTVIVGINKDSSVVYE
jgi:ribose 5-phosphate isomerase A